MLENFTVMDEIKQYKPRAIYVHAQIGTSSLHTIGETEIGMQNGHNVFV